MIPWQNMYCRLIKFHCLFMIKKLYLTKNACDKIKWVANQHKIWCKYINKMEDIHFYLLNIVNEYNRNTNIVYISDELGICIKCKVWQVSVSSGGNFNFGPLELYRKIYVFKIYFCTCLYIFLNQLWFQVTNWMGVVKLE